LGVNFDLPIDQIHDPVSDDACPGITAEFDPANFFQTGIGNFDHKPHSSRGWMPRGVIVDITTRDKPVGPGCVGRRVLAAKMLDVYHVTITAQYQLRR
jgi:hypothetical protein